MTLSAIGIGMVSPGGTTAQDHAFFLRAGLITPQPSPFVTRSGERVDAFFCPWIGARLKTGDRLVKMAQLAAKEALGVIEEQNVAQNIPILLVMGQPRPGLSRADQSALVRAMKKRFRSPQVVSFWGESGSFAALAQAFDMITTDRKKVVAVVAVDSFVNKEALDLEVGKEGPPPSEAAAVVLLTEKSQARRGTRIGDVLGVAIHDGDLASAVRGLPDTSECLAAYGQSDLDEARRGEWAKVPLKLKAHCLESEIGRVGAASGIASLVYGLACARHHIERDESMRDAPFIAWAAAENGARAAALARGIS
jgi:hypothetical protein